MQFKSVSLLAALVLTMLSSAAQAEVMQFQFSGAITYSSPVASLAPVGSIITGSFSYDTSTPAAYSFSFDSGYQLASYAFGSSFGMTASVAGHTITTPGFSVEVTNNFGGNVEDGIEVSGGKESVDGVAYPDGSFGFVLYSGPAQTDVLTSTALPTSISPSSFNAGPTLNYGWLNSSGAQDGALLQFSINSVSAVPEPGSLPMTALGLVCIGMAYRRKH